MNIISKLQPIIIIFSAIVGLILGKFISLGTSSASYVELFLMLLLFMLFISVDFASLKKSFFNVRYTVISLFINFIITPVLAYVLGKLFFEGAFDIRIGLLILLVTPCTDWYLVFTGLSKGNVELNLSILPLNLLLQIVLLPVYLTLFFGNASTIQTTNMLWSILFVVCIPFIASIIYKIFTKNKIKLQKYVAEQSDNLQLIFLCLAVLFMFMAQGESILKNPLLVVHLLMPLLCFFVIIFIIAQIAGRLLHFNKQDIIALNFTTLARNSPLALAIAVTTFPDQPFISLVLVVGSLIELPTLSVISAILLRWGRGESSAESNQSTR